jgi:hypothetical protein
MGVYRCADAQVYRMREEGVVQVYRMREDGVVQMRRMREGGVVQEGQNEGGWGYAGRQMHRCTE